MNLEHCLRESDTSHLRAIAAFRKVDVGASPSRSEVIAALQSGLLLRDACRKTIEMLNICEKEILFQVRDAGGVVPVSDLEKSWGVDDPEVARRWFWHKTVSRGLARLRLAGLLYCVNNHDTHVRVYAFPEEFGAFLVTPEPDTGGNDYTPYQYTSTGFTILADMYYLLQYLSEYRVRTLLAGTPAKRHKPLMVQKLNALTPSMRQRDELYVDMLLALARKLGFLVLNRKFLSVDRHVADWFERSRVEQIRDLYRAWLDIEHHENALTANGVTVLTAGLRHPVRRVKRAVVTMLSLFPTEQWITIQSISEYVHDIRPCFYRPDQSSGLWLLKDCKTQETIPVEAVWDNLEHHLIDHITAWQLAWLGLVDVGLDGKGKRRAVRIHRLGRSIMSDADDIIPCDGEYDPYTASETLNKIVVQPDFDVLAPAGMVLAVRDKLEKIAEIVSGGHLQRYKISRDMIAKAMESGFDGDKILVFLDSVSHNELPQNVRTSIQDWIEEYGKVEINAGMVLTTADRFIMQEIQAQPEIRKMTGDTIGPTGVWVDEKRVHELITELKRMGYLPKMHPDTAESADMASISLKMDAGTAEYLLTLLNDIIHDSVSGNSSQKHRMVTELTERLKKSLKS